MDLRSLAQDMLNTEIGSKNCLENIKKDILEQEHFFLLTIMPSKELQENEVTDKIYIDDTGLLLVFLSEDEMSGYANLYGYNTLMMDREKFINVLRDNRQVKNIKIFSFPPLAIILHPTDFMPEGTEIKKTDCTQREFVEVANVKKALDTYETNARSKLDPGGRYENIHTLINFLVLQNHIDYEDMDRSLDIVNGYTRNFCTKISDGYPSMEIVKTYLTYFGLQEYLYVYKKNCLEMINYLKGHKIIDKYSLKTASGKFERLTRLVSV